jgi:hypothetical protein
MDFKNYILLIYRPQNCNSLVSNPQKYKSSPFSSKKTANPRFLTPKIQIEIASRVAFEFYFYHKAFLTYQKFPEHNDRRMAVSNGHYTILRREGAEKYMEGVMIPGQFNTLLQWVFRI